MIAAAVGATVSGKEGGAPATSGGTRGARRFLTLGFPGLEINTMECLRDLLWAPEHGHLISTPAVTCTIFRALHQRQRS